MRGVFVMDEGDVLMLVVVRKDGFGEVMTCCISFRWCKIYGFLWVCVKMVLVLVLVEEKNMYGMARR